MNRVTRKLDTRARRGEVARLLVVGLGNPGVEFEGTRHNVGANAVEVLAGRLGGILKSDKKTRSEYCELRVERAINIAPDQGDDGGSHKVVLAVPSTFMNDSGLAVRKLVERFSIDNPENLIVVHDEMDLENGRVKIKQGGGLAGHKGLQSIRDHIHSSDFTRVRIGIGKPPGRQSGADFVLRRPSKQDREQLNSSCETAASAIEVIFADGVGTAMNRFNG